MTTRFVPSEAGIAELFAAPEMVVAMVQFAEPAAAEARQLVPPDEDDPEKFGHYADQVEVDGGVENGVAVARINANKFTSHWLEFGTVKMVAHAPLRRGAEAAGLEVIDWGKK